MAIRFNIMHKWIILGKQVYLTTNHDRWSVELIQLSNRPSLFYTIFKLLATASINDGSVNSVLYQIDLAMKYTIIKSYRI